MDSYLSEQIWDLKSCSWPFGHVIIDNFFSPDQYELVVDHFNKTKARGLSETFVADQLSRFPNYDAYCYVFNPERDAGIIGWDGSKPIYSPLHRFISQSWRQRVEQFFNIRLTKDVIAEYHHHREGSLSGTAHSDYNQCCIMDRPDCFGMNPWYFQCKYAGDPMEQVSPDLLVRMRAAAFLFYLDPQPTKGGATLLFNEQGDMVKRVEPVPNRMFCFAVSPTSWHKFEANEAGDRNTVIGWFHMTTEDAEARFGKAPTEGFAPMVAGALNAV